MRVLILGASGMLGHKLLQVLADSSECWGTVRQSAKHQLVASGYEEERLVVTTGLPVGPALGAAFDRTQPDVVVNCIGVVKQAPEAQDPVRAITVNSLFPHQVAEHCSSSGVRLIHISTDCVFSGAQGHYSEMDTPDADDLYGRSKLLGEVTGDGQLTIRTSILGREIVGQHGLVEWFIGQRGREVRGFCSAFFSGLTTLALAHVIEDVVQSHQSLSGLFHVASARIDKDSLLRRLDYDFGTGITILPDYSLTIDRSLDGAQFQQATGISVPAWDDMVEEMVRDSEAFGYDHLREERSGGKAKQS